MTIIVKHPVSILIELTESDNTGDDVLMLS